MKTCTRFLAAALLTVFAAVAQAEFVKSHELYKNSPSGVATLTSPLGNDSEFVKVHLEGTGLPSGSVYNNTYSFTANLNPGQIVTGYAAYDFRGHNMFFKSATDYAYLTVTYGGNTFDIERFTSRDWKEWSYTATALGQTAYTFTFVVQGQSLKPSDGLFYAVPEPSTWIAGALASLLIIPSLFRSLRARISKG